MFQNEEEEDWLCGETTQASDGDEFSDDEDACMDGRRMEVDGGVEVSDNEDGDAGHYLDADLSTAAVAQQFVLQNGGGGGGEEAQTPDTQACTREHVRCGCSHDCMRKVSAENVEVICALSRANQ